MAEAEVTISPTDQQNAKIMVRLIEAAPAHHRTALSFCELRSTSDHQFIPVLVVNRPEHWFVAGERLATMLLNSPGSKTKLSIPFRGISMAQYELVEMQNPIPEWDEPGEPSPEFKQAQDNAVSDRVIAIMELSIGTKFPGESAAEKRDFLDSRNEADRDAITSFIRRNVCNYETQADVAHPLLRKYEDDLTIQGADIVEFKDFEDWKKAAEMQHILRFQRFGDPYIMEFPLRSMSAEVSNRIAEETREPTPPASPQRDAVTGRLVPGEMSGNRFDVQYLRKVRAAAQARVVKYLSACLLFQIPGGDEKAQYDWVAKRLAGDLMRVKRYIENDILGVELRYDFFSAG